MNKLEQVQQLLKSKKLDAIVILSDYNRRYLSEFTGTSGALIISSNHKYLVTDFRYTEQAKKQATEFEIVNRKNDMISEIKSILEKEKLENVGFEGH